MTVVNKVYPAGLALLGQGGADLTSDQLNLQCVDDTYTYSDTHTTTADIAATVIGAEAAVDGTLAMVGGILTTDTAVTTLPSVPADTNDVAGIVLWHDPTGTLLALWQRQGDTTEIVVVTDGGDVEVEFTKPNPDTGDFEIMRF